jgi:hypothetical protein
MVAARDAKHPEVLAKRDDCRQTFDTAHPQCVSLRETLRGPSILHPSINNRLLLPINGIKRH